MVALVTVITRNIVTLDAITIETTSVTMAACPSPLYILVLSAMVALSTPALDGKYL